jgi:hypothetical protein
LAEKKKKKKKKKSLKARLRHSQDVMLWIRYPLPREAATADRETAHFQDWSIIIG